MFGDTLLLTPALVITASFWKTQADELHGVFHQGWWFSLMAGVAIFLAYGLHLLDKPRYIENNAEAALRNPCKIFHDWVIVPTLIGMLLSTSIPLIFVWDRHAAWVLGLVFIWFVLVVIDDKVCTVDPRWQYKF